MVCPRRSRVVVAGAALLLLAVTLLAATRTSPIMASLEPNRVRIMDRVLESVKVKKALVHKDSPHLEAVADVEQQLAAAEEIAEINQRMDKWSGKPGMQSTVPI